eukprot:1160214-Pelagomonas_calceolata.AAC.2
MQNQVNKTELITCPNTMTWKVQPCKSVWSHDLSEDLCLPATLTVYLIGAFMPISFSRSNRPCDHLWM